MPEQQLKALLAHHTSWPESMAPSIKTIGSAVAPVVQALKAKDAAGAKKALGAIGDAPRDLTHGFYDKWLMGPEMMAAR